MADHKNARSADEMKNFSANEKGRPIKRKRTVPNGTDESDFYSKVRLDENGNPVKRKVRLDENGNPVKRKVRLDENGNPVKRKVRLDENGNPVKRKVRLDENGNPVKRKVRLDENGNPVKRKVRLDENGNPIKRKTKPKPKEKLYDGSAIEEQEYFVARKNPLKNMISLEEQGGRKAERTEPPDENAAEKAVEEPLPQNMEKNAVNASGGAESENLTIQRQREPVNAERKFPKRQIAEDERAPRLKRRSNHDLAGSHAEKKEPQRVKKRRTADRESIHNRADNKTGVRKRRQAPESQIRKRGKKIMNGNKPVKDEKLNNLNNTENDSKGYEVDSSRGCLFPIFLVLICVVIFVVSFTVFISYMSNHSVNDIISYIKGEPVAEEEAEATSDSGYVDTKNLFKKSDEELYNTERTGVVHLISLASNTIDIYDVEREESVQLSFNNDTRFLDEDGNSISVSKIDLGDSVIFVYNEEKKLTSFKLTKAPEETTSLGAEISLKGHSKNIKLEDKTYVINDNTMFLYKNGKLSPSAITKFDLMTVRGSVIDGRSTAWVVIMEKAHGTLELKEHESLSDPQYSVDGEDFEKVPYNGKLYLTEGVHTIIIKSPECKDYEKQVIIKRGVVEEMNLSLMQVMKGSVVFDTTATDAALYVDGIKTDTDNPIFLEYGTHELTFRGRGRTVSKYIEINKEKTNIDLDNY